MPTVAPYGTWKSPIEADLITQKSIQLVDIIPDPITGELFHVEGRPSEGGRNVIVRSRTNEDIFGPGWNARSGVH
ncbi:putative dipeptidyl-peptidase 5, partial [Serendipita sp. 398]